VEVPDDQVKGVEECDPIPVHVNRVATAETNILHKHFTIFSKLNSNLLEEKTNHKFIAVTESFIEI
jgi:hypothetical protein